MPSTYQQKFASSRFCVYRQSTNESARKSWPENESDFMLSYPALRCGAVIGAGESLDREQGLAVATDIVGNATEFERSISSEMTIQGFERPTKVNRGSNLSKTKFRIWPTIVIDFSDYTCYYKKRKLSVRACLTVCTGDGQSKCWIRVNSLDNDIVENKYDVFFDELEIKCKNILKKIIEVYQNKIESTLQKEFKLKKYFSIVIRSASADDLETKSYFDLFFERDALFDVGSFDKLAIKINKNITKIDNGFTNIPRPNEMIREGDSTLRNFGYAALRSPLYSEGNFTTHPVPAVCVIRYDNSEARLVGLGIDRLGSKLKPLESASHVVSSSLAGEYGGLF